MLDTPDQERIFYEVSYSEGEGDIFVTGYPDLPRPDGGEAPGTPSFYERLYRGEAARLAALRAMLPAGRPVTALIQVAETVRGRKALTPKLADRALRPL